MPVWILLAAGAQFLNAIVALVDKYIVTDERIVPQPFVYAFYTCALSGAAIGRSVGSMYKDMDRRQNVGHFFCLLDIAAHMEVSRFKERIDAMIDEIKRSRRRPGVEEILVPGELEHRTAIRNRREGIPIDEPTLGELETLCGEYGVSGLAG